MILEGVLVCTSPSCLHEYPVIDGIPILVADLRTFMTQNMFAALARQDLGPSLQSLIGDCLGPGSALDAQRQQLSTYAHDHYEDLAPDAREAGKAGFAARLIREGLGGIGEIADGPVVDLGCAVGRTTFELARALDRPVLGIDLNVGMLRLAARVLSGQGVCYPLRRVGMVYDQRQFDVSLDGLDHVDFWACDATCLPLGDHSVALAASLNVIDCLASPYDHLKELARVLLAGGRAIISSPYDWNPGATPVEAWIGGHSQRSETGGQSDVILRSLLAGGGHPQAIESLQLVDESPDLPWQLRLHDRGLMQYQVHLLTVQKSKT